MIKLNKNKLLKFNQDKIKNKNILVRVDFNINFINGKIFDKYRIFSAKKTIDSLKQARQIILISHFQNGISLKKIIPSFEKLLKIKIGFLEDLKSKPKEKFNFLENIRNFKGEENCDLNFAKELSSLGEIFIFEAFSVAHRKHASVYLLPKILETYYGFNFEKEINLLNKVLKNLNKCVLVLSGAKISTKLPLVYKFAKKSKCVVLAGGLANTFLKAKGFELGKSLYEEKMLKELKYLKSPKILVPFDFLIVESNEKINFFNKSKPKIIIKNKFLGEIGLKDFIVDIGQESLKILFEELKKEKYIIWNGPLGFIENKPFQKGTLEFAKFLLKLKNKFILVGGGDTLSFLEQKRLISKFKNVSTGGGAMLHYLATETFPAFEKKSNI
jgi:phosphoglycerate kinase